MVLTTGSKHPAGMIDRLAVDEEFTFIRSLAALGDQAETTRINSVIARQCHQAETVVECKFAVVQLMSLPGE
ncbi:MAG: hypothetical protein V3U76_03170 [Granulosicoccus sp.]